MIEIFSTVKDLYFSTPIYFLGMSCFFGTRIKYILKETHFMVKLAIFAIFTFFMVYKPYTITDNKVNKIKLFGMNPLEKFDFKKFTRGYKDLMVTQHPDTSGYDSAEDFAETRRFYSVLKDKVYPENIWQIYVQFGEDFNIYSD